MDKRWLKLHRKMTLLWITRYTNVWLFSNDPAIKTWTPAPISPIYAQTNSWKRQNLSWGLEGDITPVVTTKQGTDIGYLTNFTIFWDHRTIRTLIPKYTKNFFFQNFSNPIEILDWGLHWQNESCSRNCRKKKSRKVSFICTHCNLWPTTFCSKDWQSSFFIQNLVFKCTSVKCDLDVTESRQ